MDRKALSLVELLVSMVILAITMVGLVNLLLTGREYITHSRLRMAGSELGKIFLDPKRMLIRQDNWGTAVNCLSMGNCPALVETDSSGRNYTANYFINNNSPMTGVHRVRVNITWPEG